MTPQATRAPDESWTTTVRPATRSASDPTENPVSIVTTVDDAPDESEVYVVVQGSVSMPSKKWPPTSSATAHETPVWMWMPPLAQLSRPVIVPTIFRFPPESDTTCSVPVTVESVSGYAARVTPAWDGAPRTPHPARSPVLRCATRARPKTGIEPPRLKPATSRFTAATPFAPAVTVVVHGSESMPS